MTEPTEGPLKSTALTAAHRAAGARMAPFAGYDMPIQYPTGVLAEHRWTREHAGLFDVSHMGPSRMELVQPSGDAQADWERVARLAERLVCGDIVGLKPGQLRYSLLLNDEGGIVDDLMIGRFPAGAPQHQLYLIVNASTKDDDFARFEAAAGGEARVVRMDDAGLLALQGPEAVDVLTQMLPGAAELGFMQFTGASWRGAWVTVARSGYTGEDGFEVLVPPEAAAEFWEALTADARVKPVGLGARDSLRLEAGLPLYGHDLDGATSPVEADLTFAINKRRREAGDFPGAERILRELREGPSRVRVGLKLPPGGAPAREGSRVVREYTPEQGPEVVEGGHHLGVITSGGPSPKLGHGVAMAYLPADHRAPGTRVKVVVRGRELDAEVVAMPFVPHRYVRKPASAPKSSPPVAA